MVGHGWECAIDIRASSRSAVGKRAAAPPRARTEGKKEGKKKKNIPDIVGPTVMCQPLSPKPPSKTTRWLNVNSFDSSMVNDTRFWI